jgi:hypothetical protein
VPIVEKPDEEYSEASPYIQRVVEGHGEKWMTKNDYPKIAQVRFLRDITDVEDLSFYDEEMVDVLDEAERIAMAEIMSEYQWNLRSVSLWKFSPVRIRWIGPSFSIPKEPNADILSNQRGDISA